MAPFWVGILVGAGAAVVQAFFHVLPPPAYGVCIACHMRDLVNWVAVRAWPLYGLLPDGAPRFVGGGVSEVIPVLTVLGILGGAFLGAKAHGEFRWRALRVSTHRPLWEFFLGMGVMASALLMGGCPLRTALKGAYLDLMAMVALGMIFVGVIVASEVLKRTS